MGVLLHMSVLVATVYLLHVYGYEEENEYKRVLEELRLPQRQPMLNRRQTSRRLSSRRRQQWYGHPTRFSSRLYTGHQFRRNSVNRRRHVACVNVGASCDAVLRKCCGTSQCYWQAGYSMLKKGVCVDCVPREGKCQRNAQCCTGLQCEKGNLLWLDGRCRTPRTSGHCYQDSQCRTDCRKKWWAFTGVCE